jgi:phage/plasmid-like protein (TIGR03299 family)
MAHMVETAAYAKVPAWHGVGTVVSDAMTWKDALHMASIDWPVEMVDVFRQQPESQGMLYEDIKGYKATVRATDKKVLGVVSDRYEIVQNNVAFAFMENLIGEGVRYEAAGSLNGGKKVWLLAKLPKDVTVLGDKVCPYVVFTNGHDGKHSVKVALTPVRVVCQNTLTLALNSAPRFWQTHHIGDVMDKIGMAQSVLQLADDYMWELPGVAEEMAAKVLYEDEFQKFLEELFPIPLKAERRATDNILGLRKTLWNIHEHYNDLSQFKYTAWGVYNAVADMTSHWQPAREMKDSVLQSENQFARTVEGHPVLVRAQKLLQKVKA